jgi:hypothetical protein
VIPLLGDESLMPAENRVRRESTADLAEQLSAQQLPFYRKATLLIVI